MFKRLKDKITEEVKISPSKFTASVQQLQQMAQAVVSPTANSVIEAPSMGSFSIDADYDDTPQNSPAHSSSRTSGKSTPTMSSPGDPSTFTLVDLQEPPPTPVTAHGSSRRSSFASTTSESPAILFPVLETGTVNHFQSDLESCSERDESIFSSNVENVSKEHLLSAFRKTQQRYHKYKGRYTDLNRLYKELERENTKARTILAESQDKALRRIEELKEQCHLEQKAKAHLEEALRSDLEEKDHVIHTLNTKIQLLKSGVDPSKVSSVAASGGETVVTPRVEYISPENEAPSNPALLETEADSILKKKVNTLEALLHKCKEAIDTKQQRIYEMEKEKETKSEREAELENKFKELKQREEETSLSVAENKLMVHRELESKDEVIRQLNNELSSANTRCVDLQKEIELLQDRFKKDLAAGKQEATRLIHAEMQQIVGAKETLEEKLATREQQLGEQVANLSSANQRLEELKGEVESLREKRQHEANVELASLQATVSELESTLQRSKLSSRLECVLGPLREIRESAQQLRGELTESLGVTKSYFEESVQSIQSKSVRLLAESTGELERLRAEHDVSESKILEYLGKIHDLEALLEEKEDKVITIEKDLTSERSTRNDLETALEGLKRSSDGSLKVLEDAKLSLQGQLEATDTALKECKAELESMREGLLSAESSERKFVEKLQQQIKDRDEENEKIRGDLKLLDEQLQLERDRLEELKMKANSLASLEAQINSLKSQNAQLEADKKALTADKNEEISDLQEKTLTLTNEINTLKKEKDELSEKIGKFEDIMVENESIQLSETQKLEVNLTEQVKKSDELASSLTSVQSSYNALQEENSTLSQKLKCSEQKYNELKSNADTVSAQIRVKEQLIKELQEQVSSHARCQTEIKLLHTQKEQMSETNTLLESRLQKTLEEMEGKEHILEEKQTELGNALNLKTQELLALKEELDCCKTDLSVKQELQIRTTEEFEALVRESRATSEDLKTRIMFLEKEVAEHRNQESRNDDLQSDLAKQKGELEKNYEELRVLQEQYEALKSEDQSLKEELLAATDAKNEVESKLKALVEDHAQQSYLLKLKTDECAEKEAQLDNLADEMKRVDELSQELGRINDGSEAYVQVLSSEASSLAQKVEELTARTQQMKEREVELLAKAQLADECQAEFLHLKEAVAELQAKLLISENTERQLELLKQQQAQLGERLKQAEAFEDQCESLKDIVAKIPELEKKSIRLKEAEEKLSVLEQKCSLLGEECATLAEANSKLSLLEAECEALRKVNEKCVKLEEAHNRLVNENSSLLKIKEEHLKLEEERNFLANENSNLLKIREESDSLKEENNKIAELLKECDALKKSKFETEDLRVRCAEFQEQLKQHSVLQKEVAELREENSSLKSMRDDYEDVLALREKVLYLENECSQLKEFNSSVANLQAECNKLKLDNSRMHELEEECEKLKSTVQVSDSTDISQKVSDKERDDEWGETSWDKSRCLREVEVECDDLREQLKNAHSEIEDLKSDLEFVRSDRTEKLMPPAGQQRIEALVSLLEHDNSTEVPVVEEPVIVKKVKDLYHPGHSNKAEEEEEESRRNWKDAYHSLLQEHKASMEQNQELIEHLKEQIKQREEKPRKKPWERKEPELETFAGLEAKALASGSNSVGLVERLQYQLAGLQTQLKDSKRQHRQEVSELRRMLLNNSHGSSNSACTLEDATELEYLRNILFEYMMGKEPMVLARVIAAVVKFDSDQTKKILQREEQRLTLLGHLGMS